MRIKLPEHLTNKLLDLPESGMGYHRVLVKFVDGSTLNTYVLNSEWLVLPDEAYYLKEISDIE